MNWDKAEATIVDREAKYSGERIERPRTPTPPTCAWHSGETFRATIHEPTIATDFWPPNIRDVVGVLVKSKDRKVKFDKDDDRLSVKAYDAGQEEVLRGVPATSPWFRRPRRGPRPRTSRTPWRRSLLSSGSPGHAMQVVSGDSAAGPGGTCGVHPQARARILRERADARSPTREAQAAARPVGCSPPTSTPSSGTESSTEI